MKQTNVSEKDLIMYYVLGAIPESFGKFSTIEKIIKEVRLAISELGGANGDDEQIQEILDNMKKYNLVSIEDEQVRRKVPVPDRNQVFRMLQMMQMQKRAQEALTVTH